MKLKPLWLALGLSCLLPTAVLAETNKQIFDKANAPYQVGKSTQVKSEFDRAYAAYQAGNYAEAKKGYEKLAAKGNRAAQNNLGALYANGQGVKQDYSQAAKWYRKAAEQGFVKAQITLGFIHGHLAVDYKIKNDRNEATKHYNESTKWFRKAAEQGDASAQNLLGNLYRKGSIVNQDYNEAMKWYQKAAEQQYAMAYMGMAEVYMDKRKEGDENVDMIQATKWVMRYLTLNTDPFSVSMKNSYGILKMVLNKQLTVREELFAMENILGFYNEVCSNPKYPAEIRQKFCERLTRFNKDFDARR